MKTHFDPYSETSDPEEFSAPEVAPCGSIVGDEYLSTSQWIHVDCKRCLSKKESMQKGFDATEAIIVKQVGDMADFMERSVNCGE
jgi:hypothetical protein